MTMPEMTMYLKNNIVFDISLNFCFNQLLLLNLILFCDKMFLTKKR